jgi:Ca2+/Na+ antiporter
MGWFESDPLLAFVLSFVSICGAFTLMWLFELGPLVSFISICGTFTLMWFMTKLEASWNARYYNEIEKIETPPVNNIENDLRSQFEEFITYFKMGNTITFEFSIKEDKNRKSKSYCYKFSTQE